MPRSTPKLTDTEREILTACRDRMAADAEVPEPDRAARWVHAAWVELRDYGPRWQPASMFGGGEPLPEHVRVRYLRALRRLEVAGLLETFTGEGGRLENVKLTEAGLMAAGKRRSRERSATPTPEPEQPEPTA